MNIQESNDKILLQDSANMNFNSDGQPFAEFINQDKAKDVLQRSAKDIAEEKATELKNFSEVGITRFYRQSQERIIEEESITGQVFLYFLRVASKVEAKPKLPCINSLGS